VITSWHKSRNWSIRNTFNGYFLRWRGTGIIRSRNEWSRF